MDVVAARDDDVYRSPFGFGVRKTASRSRVRGVFEALCSAPLALMRTRSGDMSDSDEYEDTGEAPVACGDASASKFCSWGEGIEAGEGCGMTRKEMGEKGGTGGMKFAGGAHERCRWEVAQPG